MRFAGNGIRRIKGFFSHGTPASTGWRYPQYDKQWENEQLHYSSASLLESDSGNPGSESPFHKTPMSPPIYADDLLEIYDPLDANSPGSTMEHTMVQLRACQNHTQSTILRSCSRDMLKRFLMLPGRFVPGRTFGMLRSAMISTAIFDSPLQPTEKPCSFQN